MLFKLTKMTEDRNNVSSKQLNYEKMVLEAIRGLKDKNGSRKQDIIQYINNRNEVQSDINANVKSAMLKLLNEGLIKPTRHGGPGLAGRFLLGPRSSNMTNANNCRQVIRKKDNNQQKSQPAKANNKKTKSKD